jgi:hypothetical protein
MKIRLLLIIIFSLSLLIGCKKKDENADPNVIGGDPNTEIGQVGNTFALSLKFGNQSPNLNEDIKVISNNNGLVTLKVKANVNQAPQLKELLNRIPPNKYSVPANLVDAQGNVDFNVQFKVTSEGIQDYLNAEGKPHTLVKYDAKVGDQYIFKKADGSTEVRTVTARSQTDDFPYGFYYIKTITVEQESRLPGVNKIIYKANHKFGLVHIEVKLDDGTSLSSYIF